MVAKLPLKSVATLLLSGWLLTGCASPTTTDSASESVFTLTIAHINDTHSAFDPIPGSFNVYDQQIFNQFGGHPRLLTKAETYRQQAAKADQSFLFLHGGDAWQGTAYFKVNEGQMNADILSRMQIDAMALGNHEFDLNNQLLNEFLANLSFPVLAANVDISQDQYLKDQDNLLPYVIFAFNGYERERLRPGANLPSDRDLVAVMGLALDDMPQIAPNTGDVIFHDLVSSAQATVDELQARGIDRIVAVTHLGHSIDQEVAEQVTGLDAIVGGHSHTLLGDFSDLGHGDNGPYAEQIVGPDGSPTCIVQAGEYAAAIGRAELSFGPDGQLLSCTGGNTLLSNDRFYQQAERTPEQRLAPAAQQQVKQFIAAEPRLASVPEEQSLRYHIDTQYRPAMEAAYGEALGRVPQRLTHVRRPGDGGSDEHGSEVAPLVAQAQFEWANSAPVQALTGRTIDLALVGAGGIRTHLSEGLLREGDITLELLPFANYLSVLSLTGQEIAELLTETITATLPAGAHAGRFPYGGMLRYTFTREPGTDMGELTRLDLNRGTASQPEWEPLAADQSYQVVMNSYNATGNDGWHTLANTQQNNSDRLDLAYVNGELQAFAVEKIERSDGRLHVRYETEELTCEADSVQCNTDALAVVEYFRELQGPITALPEPVVTLN